VHVVVQEGMSHMGLAFVIYYRVLHEEVEGNDNSHARRN
jgi:hypothetical protein